MINNIFLHVGFHKTATTWLQEKYFNKHQDILYLGKAQKYPVPEIIDIFHDLYEAPDTRYSLSLNRRRWNDIITYMSTARKRIIGMSDEGLSGGADWFGGQSLFVAERIKALFYDYNVKIIIGIREQISMLASFYSEYVRRGGTNSIERLIYSPVSSGRHALEKLHYHKFIQHYYQCFGKENVFVYLLEEIHDNPGNIIGELSKFLDISVCDLDSSLNEKVRTRLSVPAMLMTRIVNIFLPGHFNNNALLIPMLPLLRSCSILLRKEVVKKTFPKCTLISHLKPYELEIFLINYIRKAPDATIDMLDKLIFSKFQSCRFNLSDKMVLDLRKRYMKSNDDLSKLIDKDLDKYGYSC